MILTNFGIEFIVLKVGKKRTPWRLRRTINRIVYDGNGCEEVRNHRAVVRFELPSPYDACTDNGKHQSRCWPDLNLVQPTTARSGDMREGKQGWESVPEGIAETKRAKMRREAFRSDDRWTTVVVDIRLSIRIHVASGDHMDTFFITEGGLR